MDPDEDDDRNPFADDLEDEWTDDEWVDESEKQTEETTNA